MRVQFETEALKPLAKYCHHALRIICAFKTEDTIIRVADERGLATQPRPDFLGEPQIQHVVQIGVPQQRREYSLDAKANFDFERQITRWRRKAVVDLRRKEYYSYVTWRDPRKRKRRKG